ncbi:hypothetical protein Tco_1393545 [Tanacetum coccineum]
MEMKDTLTSCSDLEEQQMQQIQDKAKKSCMVFFRLLYSHLKLLSNNDLKRTRTEDGFKRAFAKLFRHDVEIFTSTMILNIDQLEKQLDKEDFHQNGPMAAFRVLETQFQKFIKLRISLNDEDEQDTSSRSGNDAHADDADIRPIYDEEPMTKHYKELSDSIKTTRAKTIEHTTSLIAQNAEFKAQLQEKGFAIAALKNELRKLKGTSVDTKFATSSILGKLVLQPLRN